MKSIKQALTAEERLLILEKVVIKFANQLEKLGKQLDKLGVPVTLHGNYGMNGATASARLLFVINELRGIARDCRPAPQETKALT